MSPLLLKTALKPAISSGAKVARRSMAAAASSESLVPTTLNQWHKDLGGEMVPFAGYELPVLYKGDNAPNGGVMKEHLWCRSEGKASLFDVSHMGQVRFSEFSLRLFANKIFLCFLCDKIALHSI